VQTEMLGRIRPVAQALEHKADKRDRRGGHEHSKDDMRSDVWIVCSISHHFAYQPWVFETLVCHILFRPSSCTPRASRRGLVRRQKRYLMIRRRYEGSCLIQDLWRQGNRLIWCIFRTFNALVRRSSRDAGCALSIFLTALVSNVNVRLLL
jgi:hypothetical protein